MAHLWVIDEGLWSVLPLLADIYDLDAGRPASLPEVDRPSPPAIADTPAEYHRRILLMRTRALTDGWALVADAAAGARVNGQAVSSGIRLVADRDAIRVNGRPSMFFSTETLAHIAPFPGAEQPVCCPRCRDSIAADSPGPLSSAARLRTSYAIGRRSHGISRL